MVNRAFSTTAELFLI